MEKYCDNNNNNMGTINSTKNQLQAKNLTLEAKITYTEPSVEDIASVMSVSGVPVPGKTIVLKPNVTSPSYKANILKDYALYIQGFLKHK